MVLDMVWHGLCLCLAVLHLLIKKLAYLVQRLLLKKSSQMVGHAAPWSDVCRKECASLEWAGPALATTSRPILNTSHQLTQQVLVLAIYRHPHRACCHFPPSE